MKTPATPYEVTSAPTSASYHPDTAIGQILMAFSRGESLTSMEALQRFGSFRLPAVVKQLKYDGFRIDSETVAVLTSRGKISHVARYTLSEAV